MSAECSDIDIPPGYKQTEVGVIPEDWDVSRLIECADYVDYRGKTPTKTLSGVSLITARNIRAGFIDYEVSQEYISESEYESAMHRGKPCIGDVLITTEAPLGMVASVTREDIALAQRVIKYRGKTNKLRSEYLKFYLLSPKFQTLLEENSSGSTAKGIKGSVLHQLQVILPPLLEQESIAEALSYTDALIESLEQLIAKKRQIKQGAMQELLTGKRRLSGFSGDWETKLLGNLGNFLKGRGVAREESLTGNLPCIRYGEIYTKHNDYIKEFHSWISREVAATAMRLNCGDILFAGSGETKEEIGKCVAFVDKMEAYAGGDIVILRPQNVDSLFFGYYLNTVPINQQKASRGQGDAIVHIGASALADIKITIPSLPEQTAIASIFSDMDSEITALEEKLAKTRQIKQGMMKELLTGRVRLI